MTSMLRLLLQGHTADLDERRLHANNELDLRNLALACREDATTDAELERAALDFLENWNGHVVKRKCARFGLILWATRHLPENADRVADWDARMARHGGLDGWYLGHTGQQAVAA